MLNIFKTSSRFFRVLNYCHQRNLSVDLNQKSYIKEGGRNIVDFYLNLLDLNTRKAVELVQKHPELWRENVDFYEINNTVQYLKANKMTNDDILNYPSCMLLSRMTLMNRKQVLHECGFQKLQIYLFHRFLVIMKKEINRLKAFNYIPQKKNVVEDMLKHLDVPITFKEKVNEEMSLQEIRKKIINLYLARKLQMTEEDITKTFHIYQRLKHRSLDSIVRIIDVMENKLGYQREKIISNAFLLHACPDNLIRMLTEVPYIGNTPIEKILIQRPKIVMTSVDTIKKILEHLKSFEICESALLKCTGILTLGADTVYNRLVQLRNIEEFNVLRRHPRILFLIYFQNKAKNRLDYLKQIKVGCASIHLLSSTSETFEKYARSGTDKTKGHDILFYIAKVLNKDRDVVRSQLSRHPYWLHVPLLNVKTAFEYLRYKKFKSEDISLNIVLLLYPVERIEQKLKNILELQVEKCEENMILGPPALRLSKIQLLSLCLYSIEFDFHFSGDGIWEVNKHDQKQDIYNAPLPIIQKQNFRKYKVSHLKRNQEDLAVEKNIV
ncbi:CLUMA_CG011553, isoform A [Clunio marinus]|uniref:CLUMA_CG011553, isoform A n=1 Tax=Clunio marinus TaxID=568069 RepID=A0A1J1IF61_9DIPT|nr:CLUMA_CG011553, isoform A [Clunio marinus]